MRKIKVTFDATRLDFTRSRYRPDQSCRYFESMRAVPLRFIGYSHEIANRLRHTGWFTDNESRQDMVRGAVFQLPGRDGCARYVAGYHETCNGGFVLDLTRIYEGEATYRGRVGDDDDAKRDAALAGDESARIAAEAECEYQEAWRAGQLWANKRRDCEDMAKDLRGILAGIREDHAKHGQSMLDASAAERRLVTEKLAELRELRAECASLRADELPSRDPLRSAWLEGAECGA